MSAKDWRLKNESHVYREVYLGHRLPASVNCRNCIKSKPITESNGAVWWCDRFSKSLTIDDQKNGCSEHLWMPALVPAEHIPEDSTDDKIAYRSGIVGFFNAVSKGLDKQSFSSPELRELSKTNFDPELMMGSAQNIRESFDAEFVKVHVMDEDRIPF